MRDNVMHQPQTAPYSLHKIMEDHV